ncbi:MAG: hypothetical protein Q8R02_06435, partial [Hyphomonadaceae bacterium]|nr:hypothetical protein [Hyphomonadaceae bacterium]
GSGGSSGSSGSSGNGNGNGSTVQQHWQQQPDKRAGWVVLLCDGIRLCHAEEYQAARRGRG